MVVGKSVLVSYSNFSRFIKSPKSLASTHSIFGITTTTKIMKIKKKQEKERKPPLKSPKDLPSTHSNSTTKMMKKLKKAIRKGLELHENVTRLRRNFKPPKTHDVDEMRRLMNRIPAVQKEDEFAKCAICYAQDHYNLDCPCHNKISPGVVLGPRFDSVCIGCGTIGQDCCSEGTYAIRKFCGGCYGYGHWYWEKMCPKGKCFPPNVHRLPFTEYEEVPCPYDSFKDSFDGPNWCRMINLENKHC